MMKLMRAVTATFLYLLLLGLIYYCHIRFFPVNVIFYAALVDVVLATVIISGILFWLSYFSLFNRFEKKLLVLIWLLTGYVLAISIPTVIDRSLSFYLLEKLQQSGGGITQAGLEEIIVKEHAKKYSLIDVRLTEQLKSGTIMINDGCVKLTEKGERIANFSRFYRQHLLPKRRLLMGVYTDSLTDPFRYGTDNPEYICQ